MAHCRLCERSEVPATHAGHGICPECATTLGLLLPMPPARRPARPCMRCNGMRFVRAIPREYTAIHHGDVGWEVTAPMAITAAPKIKPAFFGGQKVQTPDILYQRHGTLETYICTGCGFVEWYCHGVDAIPIGPEYMTELVDYPASDPYR